MSEAQGKKWTPPPEKIGICFFKDGSIEQGPVGIPPSTDYILLERAEAMVREALDQVAEKIRRVGGYWGADTAADFIRGFEYSAQKEQA